MRVLLLGVGMQGKVALHDLVHSPGVDQITVADKDVDALHAYVETRGYGPRVRAEIVDGAAAGTVNRLMALGADVVIDLMPVRFHSTVAEAAVAHGVHLVNASYPTPEMRAMSDRARASGVTLLPEFGMDPGIDLVLLGEAVRSLDSIESVITYGAGFPEPRAADNPLQYKVTWTFEGVLRSYYRAGRVIRGGRVVEFGETEMFAPEHLHDLDLPGLGRLEAFPNGDAVHYAELLGLNLDGLEEVGRYVLRWPGHSALWKTLVDLHFLDEAPLLVDGHSVDRRRFLEALLEPQLQYRPDERDVVVVRIDVKGRKDGAARRVVYQVIDYRDLETGFTAMSRTVGFTASIGAQMIGAGAIAKRGLLSAVHDVPYGPFVDELRRRGIEVTTEFL